MNNSTGKVIVIVAPSGAGKTTLAKRLLDDYPQIEFSVSATTRKAREDEKNGQNYYFLTEEEFDQKIEADDFLEWEHYSGHRYGTLQSEVDKLMETGYFPLLDIEVRGALNVERIYDENSLSIFIEPPSIDELAKRLTNRGSETDKSILKRLKRAEMEMQYADRFDHIVINDDLDTAYNQICAIVNTIITEES